jgi:hypothetical protein
VVGRGDPGWRLKSMAEIAAAESSSKIGSRRGTARNV